MDLGSALNSIMEYDIKKHCHINTNEDGDRFVGIKADSDNAMVYFPIGYELPETDAEIRTDIKHLIQVLSEFTTKDDRLLAINKFAAPQTVDFPINAYKSVIEYYFSIGGTYYVEKEQVYITAPTGKQDWARTARKQIGLLWNDCDCMSERICYLESILDMHNIDYSRDDETQRGCCVRFLCFDETLHH